MCRIRFGFIFILILILFWLDPVIGTLAAGGKTVVKKVSPAAGPQEELGAPVEFPGAKIARWYNNRAAAVSITYDDANPTSRMNRKIDAFVVENGITMDYEIVTRLYRLYPHVKKYLLETMIPSGLGYFGHGDQHVNHDELSYEAALESFKKCYRNMVDFGLKPVAYAYPFGAGAREETRKALAESGFLCGRLHFSKWMTEPYIVPGTQPEPADWYALPTLVMQDYKFNRCDRCVNNDEELIPYLDEAVKRGAWIILTYHAIGRKKKYGFFNYEEFKKNIYSVKERNFWNASMNAVTLYIRERLHASVKIEPVLNPGKKIKEFLVTVSDGLPNDVYDQPLTILFDFPVSWVNKPVALVENGKVLKTFVLDSINGMISIKPDETGRKLVLLER